MDLEIKTDTVELDQSMYYMQERVKIIEARNKRLKSDH